MAKALEGRYRYEDVAVLALSPGGVVVGQEIAKRLHARISILLTEPIFMPGMIQDKAIGLIDSEGHFTYNNMIPTGELMELRADMHNYIESEKLQKLHKLTRIVNETGFIKPDMFYGHNVIVVNDGFRSGLSFDAAVNYLKPINTLKLIAAAPNVSVKAVDRLHVTADEVHILDVVANYLDTDHYFEDNVIPDVENIMDNIIHKWS